MTCWVTPPLLSCGLPAVSNPTATPSEIVSSVNIDAEDHPPELLALHQHAERVRRRERDHDREQHLDHVREPVGALEGVRGVGVEEPAAVGAELLDRELARDRAAAGSSACCPRAW